MTDAAYRSDLSLFIDGAWQGTEGRDTRPVVNPVDGEAMAGLPMATAADLDQALATADARFATWRATDVAERAAILHKTAALLRERAGDIARHLTMEQGKPLAEATGEVLGAAQIFEWSAEDARRLYGRTLVRPTGQRAMVLPVPVGPVATFTPWNFPIYLMAKKVAAALAAGCSVIAKPAEETPASTSALMRALDDAGLPKGVAQLVYGDPAMISAHLIASPVIRKISFTGSTAVGKHLMRLAADNVTQTTMELGGHAPVVVFADCDLEKTLDALVPQKFRNAGQVCVSPTRFLVEESIHDAFVAGFAKRMGSVRVGNGLDPDTKMGPLANVRRPDAVAELVADAVAQGATLKAGGHRGNGGFFFEPTLLANVPDSAAVMQTEPFGPLAVTRPFADFDEAVRIANNTPFGLAAFAFTQSLSTANRVGDALDAGMVGVNTFAVSAVDAPFGGVKQSGYGREGGSEGVESYCVTKSIHMA